MCTASRGPSVKVKKKEISSPAIGLPTAPDYGNTIQQTLYLPNNGLGTIESLKPANQFTEAPVLESPLGSESQRVKRERARLTIAA